MVKIIKKIKEKLKMSYIVVNKLYLFIIFIFLGLSNITLAIAYFFISAFIYIKKLVTSSVPMQVNEEFKMKTYIYKETEEKDLKMDIYYPNIKQDIYPLIYFCHGGGWISGYRDQPNNVSWCNFLASRGFVVASIDYRFGYKNNMMDLLSDYYDGLEYIRNKSLELSIDKNNISLIGLSAGGHMALLYATYLSYHGHNKELNGIKSVVAYYPPTELHDLLEDDKSKSLLAKFGAMQTIKDSPSEFDDVYEYYSPRTWVSDNMIPTLIVHGMKDDTVPFKSSVKFTDALKDKNIDYEFLIHRDANHSFDTRLNDYTTIDILEKTIRFIKKRID